MKSYNILLSGYAIEAYLFELDYIRLQISNEIDLINSPIIDTLSNLGFDDLGSASNITTGLLDDFTITISDDFETLYFIHSSDLENEKEYFENPLEDENLLVYENKIKGDILRLELITEDDFDIAKFKLVFTNIGYKNILTTLSYEDEYLGVDTDYLDYESTGKEVYKIINN